MKSRCEILPVCISHIPEKTFQLLLIKVFKYQVFEAVRALGKLATSCK